MGELIKIPLLFTFSFLVVRLQAQSTAGTAASATPVMDVGAMMMYTTGPVTDLEPFGTSNAVDENRTHVEVQNLNALTTAQETLLRRKYKEIKERVDVLNERLNPLSQVGKLVVYSAATAFLLTDAYGEAQRLANLLTNESDLEVLAYWMPVITEVTSAQIRLTTNITTRTATLLTLERMPIADRAQALDEINATLLSFIKNMNGLHRRLHEVRLIVITRRGRAASPPSGNELGNQLRIQVSVDVF